MDHRRRGSDAQGRSLNRLRTFAPVGRRTGLGAALTLGLHVGAGAALLAYEPTRAGLAVAAPIMVDWIAAPKPPQPEPEVRPPKPKPAIKPRPREPLPLVARPAPVAESPAPATFVAAPESEPPPAPLLAVAAPVETTPPIFNADYLKNPAPAYPAQSRRLGEEGRVVLRVLVSAAGSAQEVQVRASSGHLRLDEAARETVRQWKFSPARRGAEAVPAWVLIPIQFTLDS